MAKVVVFGVGQWAELAHFYLTHDSPHEVVAFTVDREYLDGDELQGTAGRRLRRGRATLSAARRSACSSR